MIVFDGSKCDFCGSTPEPDESMFDFAVCKYVFDKTECDRREIVKLFLNYRHKLPVFMCAPGVGKHDFVVG